MARTSAQPRIGALLRAAGGSADLRSIDPRSTPGFRGGKAKAREQHAQLAAQLAELQEMLFAEGRTGGRRSLLIVLQGLDTSGKGGTLRHVVGQMDPQGVRIAAFGPPTPEELRHDFLWRIRRRLPDPGIVGVFDRSHYEDVVTVRVKNLAPRTTWAQRYSAINRFEERLAGAGTRIVKCYLHISVREFRERQLARLDDPTKHWKFDPADLDNLTMWDDYIDAYQDALARCDAEHAPWYVVPAGRKWYRNWAITRLLIEQLEEMHLRWPPGDFDVDEQRRRLEELTSGN
jgi:PPK2 family polyphosphate:nucleotide phosphotransferase